MIPLKVQEDYKPQGWLGLIMGTRMWYAMWDAEKDDDAAFDRRLDSVVREIGERGKAMVAEAVPPFREPMPAPAPAPALVAATRTTTPAPAPPPALAPAFEPTPEPAPATAPVPTPRRVARARRSDRDSSPSMQLSPPSTPMVQHVTSTLGGGSLLEMSSFLKEQREEAKADRAELEAKLERQRQEMEARLDAKDAKLEQQQALIQQQAVLKGPPPVAAIADEQLATLQARIEGLHTAKLLTDEELFALEDLVADYVDLTMSVADRIITRDMIYAMPGVDGVASKLDKLVGLSAAMAGDAAFARQARRKFL